MGQCLTVFIWKVWQIRQNYTSVLLCWSGFQILRHVVTKKQRLITQRDFIFSYFIMDISYIPHYLKRKEAFKKPGYANWGHRRQGNKRRLIYCLDSWFISSATGKEKKGAILKIISNGVLTEMTLSDLLKRFKAKRWSTLTQSPPAVTVKL